MTEAERHRYDRSSKWLIQHHGDSILRLANVENIERCRDLIEQRAVPEERENLFAVVQVLAGLRYNDPVMFEILGGKKTMIESPIIQEIVAEALHGAILNLLKRRFDDVPPDIEMRIRSVQDNERLTELNAIAGSCASFDAFREALT